MAPRRKPIRRRRMSFARMLRETGPGLHLAYRKTRAALWRFKRSPKRQDHAAMYATFAFIGLFAIGSVDAIVTGGADFAPGSAYAAEYRPTRLTPVAQTVAAPVLVEEQAPEETLKTSGGVDYSFTAEVLLGGPETELAVTEQAAVAEEATLGGEKLEAPQPVADTSSAEEAFVASAFETALPW